MSQKEFDKINHSSHRSAAKAPPVLEMLSPFEKIDFGVPGVSWTVFDKNSIYEGENTEALQKYLPRPTRTRSKD